MKPCLHSLILQRLWSKGLISTGNITMCIEEITKEIKEFEDKEISKLTQAELDQLLKGRINYA